MANGILEMLIKQAADIINDDNNYETIVIGLTLKGKNKVFKNKTKRKRILYKEYRLSEYKIVQNQLNMWF